MFNVIKAESMEGNVFKMLGSEWMLITAGDLKSFNTMTAAWGGFGVLWSKNVCFCYVRPSRYTYEFMEKNDFFSISFFEEKYREILNFCGSHSGRDVNKVEKTGLTALLTPCKTVYFKEAKLVIECKKIYYQDINPVNFIEPSIGNNYNKNDYHRMYVGEIQQVLKK